MRRIDAKHSITTAVNASVVVKSSTRFSCSTISMAEARCTAFNLVGHESVNGSRRTTGLISCRSSARTATQRRSVLVVAHIRPEWMYEDRRVLHSMGGRDRDQNA